MNVYTFSTQGHITHYAHAFFALLIPLIEYYRNKKSLVGLNLEINAGSMMKLVNDLFLPNNVTWLNNYSLLKSNIYDNYDVYLKMSYKRLTNKLPKNVIMLDAYDIFDKMYYDFVDKKLNVNIKQLNALLLRYFKGEKLNKTDNIKRKKLLYTYLWHKLKRLQPIVCNYVSALSIKHVSLNPSPLILLIERPRPTFLTNDLYLNAGGQRRFIYNFEELSATLTGMWPNNVIVRDVGALSIYEQYNLFSNADIIIGQHGAGLCNIYFSKANKVLIEILPEWGQNNWFKNLADFCELGYIPIEQPPLTKDEAYYFFKELETKGIVIDYKLVD